MLSHQRCLEFTVHFAVGIYSDGVHWPSMVIFLAFGTSGVTTIAAVGIMTLRIRSAKMPKDPELGRGWLLAMGQHAGDGVLRGKKLTWEAIL